MADPVNALRIIPTPMGWLSPDAVQGVVNALMPTRQGVAQWAGAPVDALAYAMRRAGVPISQPAYGSEQLANWLANPSERLQGALDRMPPYQLYLQMTGQPGAYQRYQPQTRIYAQPFGALASPSKPEPLPAPR
jgi:hypothetical protein